MKVVGGLFKRLRKWIDSLRELPRELRERFKKSPIGLIFSLSLLLSTVSVMLAFITSLINLIGKYINGDISLTLFQEFNSVILSTYFNDVFFLAGLSLLCTTLLAMIFALFLRGGIIRGLITAITLFLFGVAVFLHEHITREQWNAFLNMIQREDLLYVPIPLLRYGVMATLFLAPLIILGVFFTSRQKEAALKWLGVILLATLLLPLTLVGLENIAFFVSIVASLAILKKVLNWGGVLANGDTARGGILFLREALGIDTVIELLELFEAIR